MNFIKALITIIANVIQYFREEKLKQAGRDEAIKESEKAHAETVDIANAAGDAGERLPVDQAPYERKEE